MPFQVNQRVFVTGPPAKFIFDRRPELRGPFLITDIFPSADGQLAMLKLSEHPEDIAPVGVKHLSLEKTD